MNSRQRTLALAGILGAGLAMAQPVYANPAMTAAEATSWVNLIKAMESDPTSEATLSRVVSYLNHYPRSGNRTATEYMIGEIHFQRGRYEQAMPYFAMVAGRDPAAGFLDSAEFRMGECAFNTGKAAKAQEIWNRLLERYPKTHLRSEVEINRCEMMLKQGNYQGAQDGYRTLLSRYPHYRERASVVVGLAQLDYVHQKYAEVLKRLAKVNSPESFYWKGRALFALDRFQEAATYFDKLLKFHGQHAYALNSAYLRAEAFFQGGNLSGATQAYKEFLQRYSQSSLSFYARYKLAAVLLAQKRYAEALANAGQLSGSATFPMSGLLIKYLMAEGYAGTEQFPRAASLFRDIVMANPPEAILETALLKYAWVLYKNRQFDAAAKAANRYLQDFSGSANAILAYFIMANGQFQTGQFAEAARMYREILSRFQYSMLLEVALVQLEITYSKLNQMNQIIAQAGSLVRVTEDRFKPINRNNRANALYLLGEALYHEKRPRDAISTFQEVAIKYWDTSAYAYAKESMVWALFEQNDYALALQEAEKIIKDRQIDASVRKGVVLVKGHSLFNLKRYKEALESYNEWLVKNPTEPSRLYIQYLMGLAFYRLKFYKNALEIWGKVIAQPSGNEYSRNALVKVADVLFRGGDFARARAHYQLYIQRYPNDSSAPLAQLRIAQSYYNEGQDAQAIASYRAFLQRYPKDEGVAAALDGIETTAFRQTKKQPETSNLLAFLASYPKSKFADQIQYQIADRLYKEKKYGEAIQAFNKLILNYPGSEAIANSMFYLSDCYAQLNRHEDAIAAYALFAETFPKHDLMPEVLTRMAADYFQTQKYDDAINVYRKILDQYPIKPYHEDALFNIAVCYEKQKRLSEAMGMYLDFAERYPKNSRSGDALIQVGIYYQNQQLWDLAIGAFQKAMAYKNVSRAELYFRIGDCHENVNNLPQAERAYESVIPLGPKNDLFRITALSQLAALYEKKQQWAKVIPLYRDIARNAPKPEWQQAAEARLRQLAP